MHICTGDYLEKLDAKFLRKLFERVLIIQSRTRPGITKLRLKVKKTLFNKGIDFIIEEIRKQCINIYL